MVVVKYGWPCSDALRAMRVLRRGAWTRTVMVCDVGCEMAFFYMCVFVCVRMEKEEERDREEEEEKCSCG